MLSSLPVELPSRLAWLKSGRFLRSFSALIGVAVLGAVLYNAIAVDRIPPTYTLKLSSTSGGLALTLASVEVDFSEDVQHDTAVKAFSITPAVSGSYHWQGRTLIFTPSAKLPLSTKFVAKEGPGVEDIAGNRSDGSSQLTFTTVAQPQVVTVVPGINQADVPVNSAIQVTFDRQMDTEQVARGLRISPPMGYSITWNGPVMTVQPNETLLFGTTYTIQIGDPAVDTDGTKLSAWATSFRTVGMGLAVTSIVPTPNVAGVSPRSSVAVIYDGPIDLGSIADAIKLTPPVSGSIKAVTLPDDRQPQGSPNPPPANATAGPNVLQFTPDQPLAAHTTYSVHLASVKRTDGQAANEQSWSFTTGEATSSALNQIAFLSDRGGVSNVWLMNPDGSNQRQVTTELVPVSGFDVSGDGTSIAYSAGGVVKKMGIGGDGSQTLTPDGDFEYAPAFTADGLGLVVGRRDATGKDLGYWRYPLATGTDLKQLTTDGAPGIGSASLKGDGLTGKPGTTSWAPRAAFATDGPKMLVVRGSDDALELVDTTTPTVPPILLSIIGNSRPVYDALDASFYVVGSDDKGATWSYWRVGKDGVATKIDAASADLAASGSPPDPMVVVVKTPDNNYHLAYMDRPSAPPRQLTGDPNYNESSPTFSPDGSTIVFGRVSASEGTSSAGIWAIDTGGKNLRELATDGAYPRWVP